MEVKVVTRNLNFDVAQRKANSSYRVNYGNSTNFKILRVICNHGAESKIFETSSLNLPKDKDSIYFCATPSGDSFLIKWRGEASKYMKEVSR